MKYGVLWRKTTMNIGDDMQSYAESLWYPQVDYMIDIEALDSFRSADDEPVACIMSAWYLWHKWNWPPAKCIYPLWVGFHYNDIQRGRPRGMPSKWEYLTGPGLDYLKAYAPIGCRDSYTRKRLEERGVATYYSGCVTLTLSKRKLVKPARPYFVLVGVDKKTETYVKKRMENTGIDVKIVAPTRPEPSTNLSWETRKAEVESLLDLYQNARAVLTFRLHCALPCLALETPVLMVRPSFQSVRLHPYVDYLQKATPDEMTAGKCDAWLLCPQKNPDTYKPVREALQQRIAAFIAQAKAETRKASALSPTAYTSADVLHWQHATMKQTLDNYHIEHHIDLREIQTLRREQEKTGAALEKARRQLAQYQSLGSYQRVQKELAAYRELGSVPEVQTAVRRYRRLMRLPPVRLLKKIYRLLRKNK